MKQSNIFWGILIIGIGVYLFLDSFNLVTWNFEFLTPFWSFALILWGLTFFNFPKIVKNIITPVLSIFIILLLIGFAQKSWFCDTNWNNFHFQNKHWQIDEQSLSQYYYSEPLNDSIQTGTLYLDLGAADIHIADCADSLVKIKALSENGDYYCNIIDNQAHVHYSSADDTDDWANRKANILLNSNKAWELNVSAGAGNLFCDLSKNKIKSVHLESGASKAYFKLSNLVDTVKVNIESGVSQIKLEIPKEYNCITSQNQVLSSITSYEKDKKASKNMKKVVYLDFSGALSNLNVVYY